ncbi:MAG: DinB family protein [Vicinamibacterales bacterium]|nr:DinB family protein [Vicinamibacterales bacterium]
MSERAQLLAMLDEAYDTRSWHGTNLRGSIRGMTPAIAARRPGPGRHNIWELVVHAAYWKYAVRRRLAGEKRGSFPLTGSNFWPRPGMTREADWATLWRRDVRLLAEMHRELRAVVEAFPAATLGRTPPGGGFTWGAMIRGVAAHDLYHAGQIQAIKRLVTSTGRARRASL